MFSYMFVRQSVSLSTGGGGIWPITMMSWTSLYRAPHPAQAPTSLDIRHGIPEPQPQPHSLLVTSGGHHWGPFQTGSLEDPPILTFGGHRSTYSWQVGGMHPTRMLSCFHIYLFVTTYSKKKTYLYLNKEIDMRHHGISGHAPFRLMGISFDYG